MATPVKPKVTPDQKQSLDEMFQPKNPQEGNPSYDEIAIDNLLLEVSSVETADVRVFRVMPNNKLSYIYSVHPSEFVFDDLRDKHGGGKFRLFIYGVEDGKKVLITSPQFDIEKPREAPVIAQPQPANNQPDQSLVMVQAMMQGMQAGFEQLGQLIVQSRAPQIDPDEMEQKMLNRMMVMKQLFDNGNHRQEPVQPPIDAMLNMLQKGIEMGKNVGEVRGESSPMDVLVETVKSFAPVLGSIAAKTMSESQPRQQPRIQPQAQPQPQAPITPLPVINTQQPPQPAQQPEENDMNWLQKQRLKMGLAMLVDAASRDLAIEPYAEIALDNMSDDDVNEFYSNPQALDLFIELEPRINDYRPWFDRLIETMRAMLTADPEPAINGSDPLTNAQNETNQ